MRWPIGNYGGASAWLDADGFHFLSAEPSAPVSGFDGMGFLIEIDGRELRARFGAPEAPGVATGDFSGETGVKVRAAFRPAGRGAGMGVKYTLVNESPAARKIRRPAIGFAQAAGAPGALRLDQVHPFDWRYCHTDNVRVERYPHSYADSPYVRALPATPTVLGTGEDQPFPSVFFTDREYRHGLVAGSLAQNEAYPLFEIARNAGGGSDALERLLLRWDFAQTDGRDMAAGAALELDEWYFECAPGKHPQDAHEGFFAALSEVNRFRGPESLLLKHAYYCSWNYGIYDDPRAGPLLKTAAFIAKELPNIKIFQIDAGYMKKNGPSGEDRDCQFAHGFYPDPRARDIVDAEKFPGGMRVMSNALRDLGLRPGIWFSPTAQTDSRLAREHPEWMLADANGRPFCLRERNGYVDLSVPAARRWMEDVLSTILDDWNMDAVKLDFFSHAHESRVPRLRNPSRASAGWRNEFFNLILKHLPADGVFMTCIASGMGGPSLARHADCYRGGTDIDDGRWANQVRGAIWALPAIGRPGRETWLFNPDGCGYNPRIPDNENLFRLTWCHMCMGMLEIDGRLEEMPAEWVRRFRIITDRCDRGWPVKCADERAFRGEPLPETLHVDFPPESATGQRGVKQHIALFNWTDQPRMVAVYRPSLGQAGTVRAADFWTGAEEVWSGEFLSKRLAPHSALLYEAGF